MNATDEYKAQLKKDLGVTNDNKWVLFDETRLLLDIGVLPTQRGPRKHYCKLFFGTSDENDIYSRINTAIKFIISSVVNKSISSLMQSPIIEGNITLMPENGMQHRIFTFYLDTPNVHKEFNVTNLRTMDLLNTESQWKYLFVEAGA